jgi:hypothetical protein
MSWLRAMVVVVEERKRKRKGGGVKADLYRRCWPHYHHRSRGRTYFEVGEEGEAA